MGLLVQSLFGQAGLVKQTLLGWASLFGQNLQRRGCWGKYCLDK